jgi:isoleucyl-tRNA synthetase
VTAKFKTVSEKGLTVEYLPLELEEEIRRFWEENHVQQRLTEAREKANKGSLGYVEGPPTLNGVPHIGHARGRVMKDLYYRWKTMQGYYVPFWGGWDCQGLPVELEVEKQLGVKNKRELLERVGEEHFVQECKKAIMKYQKEWVEADRKLGIFIDHSRAYWTYLDSYIEREWQYLKRAWDQGLLEEGHYVVAYCPGCQTSLSNAEVGYEDTYQQVEDPSLFFKFRFADKQNEYFLVWTTMPFTLITDTMLAVRPEAEYARVQVDDEVWILVKQRVDPVMKELGVENYAVIGTVSGKSLEHTKYEYPFKDIVPRQVELEKSHPSVHRVICEDFVDVETATGIVHLSPGNGEEDFFAAQKRGVPIFAPFDDEVKFTREGGKFCGIFARDTDAMVIEELRTRGLLVEAKPVKHEYPTCWRSHHKLVWLARKEYFLRTDKINDKVLEAAEKVTYFYDETKNRFTSFLKEGKPWCISRERVWGAPLPVWKCKECGTKTVVASKKELLEKAIVKPQGEFELHKPWVDRITFKCQKCGGTMHREDFVLDTWHNSGASPHARFTDEEFSKYVPADFLTEGVDQTRGWANSLLLEYVILTGKAEAPYRAFLFQGLAQDAKGRKMSKSLGNVIEANKLLAKHSADICRFYSLRKCSPIDFINFDPNELSRRTYQILSTLYHLNRFFVQNAEFDKFDPQRHTLQWAREVEQLKKPDLWLLSKLQETIDTYTTELQTCEFNLAVAVLEDFVIESLSRLYVPMVRKELWSDDPQTLNRRLAVYATLWHTLRIVTVLFSPVTPYLSEALHQKVYRKLDRELPESVNFENWPQSDKKLRNETLEGDFSTLFKCVSLVYSARQSAGLKRRWPLSSLVVVAPHRALASLKSVEAIFLELANVKAVQYATEKAPQYATSEAWTSASEDDIQILLDVRRDERLLGAGLMRDLARRVQALRKELGYVPTDIVETVYISELDEESIGLLEPYLPDMKELVRARDVRLQVSSTDEEIVWHESRLDNKKVSIAIVSGKAKRNIVH